MGIRTDTGGEDRADLWKYRSSMGVFILGLVFSGLTAFPLWYELEFVARLLEVDQPGDYRSLSGLRFWIGYVFQGVDETYRNYPFFGYGTDWLAFGHLVIALFFVKPLIDPQGSRWVLKCGIIACAGVIPLALFAGEVRGIPVYWRLIDCSFGVIGAIPLLYCLGISRKRGW